MINVAALTYLCAAIGFFCLGLPVLWGWRGSSHRVSLPLACLASAAWAVALAWDASHLVLWSPLAGALEVCRDAAWAVFLLALLGDWRNAQGRVRPVLLLGGLLYVAPMALLLLWMTGLESSGGDLVGSLLLLACYVSLAVVGMLLVEQVYRNRTIEERWAIKFVCLAIGSIFAYDFYLYSNTMLFREPNPDLWTARGVVNVLTVPLLALSLARRKSWTTTIAVSRRVMFHSAALFGCAIYLLAMSLVGYYLRFFGGRWGTVIQTGFLFGAVCLLGVILFSGTARSWLRVTISKHFYRYNYDYREEWMRLTRILSERGPGLGDRAIQALAGLVESPGGALWYRNENNQFDPHSHWQAPAGTTSESADAPFCQFLERTEWVIDLDEYVLSPDKYEGLALPSWLLDYPRRWMVVPLMLHGTLSGFVVLQHSRSALKLNWEIFDVLEIAGNQAASHLAQETAANALMVARQFESFNRMSTFVVHDLKNLVAQLSLMSANAQRHRDNPEFQQDMLETLEHSVQKMKLLLQKLSRTENAEQPVPLALDEVVRQAVALKGAFEPHPQLLIETPGLLVVADRERLERVLGHLIQNAIEATPRDGSVQIRVGVCKMGVHDGAQVEITDTGEGMSEEFIRERLYKPFDSTKSAGMGIGVFESREYITELGGELRVRSLPGRGTTFTIALRPYHANATVASV